MKTTNYTLNGRKMKDKEDTVIKCSIIIVLFKPNENACINSNLLS